MIFRTGGISPEQIPFSSFTSPSHNSHKSHLSQKRIYNETNGAYGSYGRREALVLYSDKCQTVTQGQQDLLHTTV